MFIEKISDSVKLAYLQKQVDQLNASNADVLNYGKLYPLEFSEQDEETLKQRGALEKIADLQKKKNLYFELYQNSNYASIPDGRAEYTDDRHQYALIMIFGDTTIETLQTELSNTQDNRVLSSNHILDCVAKTFSFIDQNRKQIDFTHDSLAIDYNYVKEFMLPNLQAIDAKQGTHLVADYKKALTTNFAKKRHLILQNLQRQATALGIAPKPQMNDLLAAVETGEVIPNPQPHRKIDLSALDTTMQGIKPPRPNPDYTLGR